LWKLDQLDLRRHLCLDETRAAGFIATFPSVSTLRDEQARIREDRDTAIPIKPAIVVLSLNL
jgi:hypothetical protein